MSKYDGEIKAVAEVSAQLEGLLGAFDQSSRTASDRHDAMAHYLSGEEGWRDARKTLRGTFAKPPSSATGLSESSDK